MLIALEKSVTLYSKNYQIYWIAPVRIRLDSRLVNADADFIREKTRNHLQVDIYEIDITFQFSI